MEMLCFGTAAWAGMKSGYAVVVDTVNHEVRGAIGTTRNSAGSSEYMGCYAQIDNSAKSMSCFARDAAGTYVTCFSSDPELVTMARAVTSDSFVVWRYTGSSCTFLKVLNASYIDPKAL
jgi:hypothetical protein